MFRFEGGRDSTLRTCPWNEVEPPSAQMLPGGKRVRCPAESIVIWGGEGSVGSTEPARFTFLFEST